MKILVFTTLFPNREMPRHGLFVKERVKALASMHEVCVVAPVPFFPPLKIREKWYRFSQIPAEEVIDPSTPSPSGEVAQDSALQAGLRGIKVYHPRYLVTPGIGRSLYAKFMAWSLRGFLQRLDAQEHFDVIDAHFVYPDGTAAVALARGLGKRIVLNARGTDINWYPQFPLIRRQIKKALQDADGIIAVSRSLKEEMKKLGIADSDIDVVPNGVDTRTFFYTPKEQARRNLNLPVAGRVIVSAGHLLKAKGFDRLIEALPLMKDRQARLVIIGEGEDHAFLEGLIAARQLEGRVQLFGPVPQEKLRDWFGAADVFAFTSLREGRPNVVVEALACGAPVVSMNNWGLDELVDDTDGILLDHYDPAGIAAALDRALAKDWNRPAIAAKMINSGWDKTAEQAAHIFRQAVGRRTGRDILFFSSDDFYSGLKTSKFHLSTRLAREHRVFFINSLSLRTPTLSKKDLRKVWLKLKGYAQGLTRVRRNLHVYTPILIPFQRFEFVRRLNKWFLLAQFRWLMARYGIQEPDIWTFLPNSVDLVTRLPRKKLVYYCVDDMSAFEGVAAEVVRGQDEELARRADAVFAVSRELCEQKKQWNPRTFYSPHGVDFELFRQALNLNGAVPPEDMRNIRGPVIGFYGLVSSDWVDYELVRFLSRRHPDYSFVFIGKVDKGKEELPSGVNIHYLGVKPYEELYRYSRCFDVAVLPFNVNGLTRHSHPLKILEYLSAGRPVVCIDIPEAHNYEGVIEIARTAEEFSQAIVRCLKENHENNVEQRIGFASQHSWENRYETIKKIIAGSA